MRNLTENYCDNVEYLRSVLRVEESFDVLYKRLKVGKGELSLFFIDGFTKDTVMQKLMMHFISIGKVQGSAKQYMTENLPYIETEVCTDVSQMITAVMSGCALMLGSSFGAEAIVIDTRTYPARTTQEPEGDRVMRGSRDGFVETLIFNTALIRRRIRNPELFFYRRRL